MHTKQSLEKIYDISLIIYRNSVLMDFILIPQVRVVNGRTDSGPNPARTRNYKPEPGPNPKINLKPKSCPKKSKSLVRSKKFSNIAKIF